MAHKNRNIDDDDVDDQGRNQKFFKTQWDTKNFFKVF